MTLPLFAALMIGLLLLGVLLWWLLIRTEGVFLGRGVVIWLYDLYARRYDRIKQFDPFNEDIYLARPILDRLPYLRAPLVLDVATGTGRLPLALLEQSTFQGRIIGLDLSRRMLTVAGEKLAPFGDRVRLMHYPAESLPFPPDTFDLVTCLEALEFTMNPRAVLAELVRVLRPGGLLVITNRQGIDARMMVGHTFGHDELAALLRGPLGMERVQVQAGQVEYRIVWAWKPGEIAPAGARPLEEVWQCPRCARVDMAAQADESGWRCESCGAAVSLAADGVIEAWQAARL